MRKIKIEPQAILLEPARRNTAPAITIAALKAIKDFKSKKEDPILLILSSDHHIENIEEFKKSIKKSIELAEDGNLIIFGVIPTFPSTGYGYIEAAGNSQINKYIPSKVEKFIEKPDANTAKLLFEDKKNSWNSGMFVCKASSILKELKQYEPEILENCENCLEKSIVDLDFLRLEKSYFEKCSDISIDVAVFEKTNKAYVLPLDCGWNDIGNWGSLWDISKKDINGNSIQGNVLAKDTKKSLIRGEDKLLVSLGLSDILIIDTKDALLVANKDFSQDIKNIVSILNSKEIIEGKEHKKIFRPWGYYLSIEEGKSWKIKKIEVNQGASLSLQLHNHRSEHWIVVQGTARVELNDKTQILSKNESIYIPNKTKHRLSNHGESELVLIEVQTGDYLGEDDIIRFDDIYGRTNNI